MKLLFEYLSKNNLTISFAESMTGGLLSYSIAKHSGASKVLKGSIIAYTKEVKNELLNVSNDTINEYSIVSKEVSYEMVNGLMNQINSNIAVSITGNAGPTLELNTSKLECYLTIHYIDKYYYIHHEFNSSNRLENIEEVVKILEQYLLNVVLVN